MSADLALRSDESARLAELEAIVTDGLNTFVTVGRALAEIRDSRLYRGSHGTFEAYCEQQWSLSRSRAYRIIEAAGITEALSPIGDTPAPANEGQARELSGLPADAAAEVMRRAHEETDGKVTASAIRQARETLPPRPDPWAARVAAELAASDEGYAEHASTLAPSPAVTEYLESAPGVADSGYVRRFMAALARSDDFLSYDADKLAALLNEDEAAAVARFAASATRFAESLRRGRKGTATSTTTPAMRRGTAPRARVSVANASSNSSRTASKPSGCGRAISLFSSSRPERRRN
jgi:hypothetical protein